MSLEQDLGAPRIVVVADDLTGALDSSAAFARRGARVVVALSAARLDAALGARPDVAVVSTNTREGTAAEAAAIVRAIAERLSRLDGVRIYKKVDSRLKGHVAAEIRALAPTGRILLCPAIPRLGRIVRNGAVCGAGVDAPIVVAGAIPGLEAETPDAEDDEALDAMVAAAGPEALLAGAAGLAEALARAAFPGPEQPAMARLRAPALFAIGSRDPVTLAQLEGLACTAAPGGAVPGLPAAETGLRVIRMTEGPERIDPATAAGTFAEGIARTLESSPRIATLVACGGETAAAILEGLGAGIVEVIGEALPGLPVSRLRLAGRELTLVTKSGGFGPPDTLRRLAGMVAGA